MRIPWDKERRSAAALIGLLLLAACHSIPSDQVQVEVRNIAMDHVAGSPVVLLQDTAHRVVLPIWIGPSEAQAIALEMGGISSPRPMTHDLMKNVMDQAGVVLDRVVIDGLKQSTYYAHLQMHTDGRKLDIDSRPSDAIALAVRFKKPIFVSRALLQGDTSIDLQRIEGTDTAHARGITVQTLSPDLAQYFQVEAGTGVLVAGVDIGDSGLQRGDVVVAINDAPIATVEAFQNKIAALGAGPAQLSIRRRGHKITVSLPSGAG